ncbi:hypothetical protein GC096_03845 [Paenibacillus sp. LMG 31461]|uniref:Uncharacterized protein n=1 Tax=Paenibacillus plantarum TaxID=2654975 RepID=A0ABX1X436_9BACL|nr:hypothetical protein [Paenibacillus plantarum]NOU63178.1 hypothetical protein [Paenibacillus plantarum]
MAITSEQALDMLPLVVDLYEKLEIDDYRKKLAEDNKGKRVDKTSVGIDLFKHIFKNSGKAKEEVFGIVAAVERKTVEDVKKQNFIVTLTSFKAIFTDKELIDFFKQAMQ